jgi:glycosyltransferase involved in cell wall biosynthesis
MNETAPCSYNYPREVNLQIAEENIGSYLAAARAINRQRKTKVVCVQHEFGIFGGVFGDYLIPFLEELKKPCVCTFHSVLPGNPFLDKRRERTVKRIAGECSKVVCISGFGRDILLEKYGIEPEKIAVIPHGIPFIEFGGGEKAKGPLGLAGKTVIMTFGLLSQRKGIEYVIRALPLLVKKYPRLVYLVVGKTHPVVKRNEGEAYRKRVVREVIELGLEKHVLFVDRYLSLGELRRCLQATDIYITPYFDLSQVSSGTLAYAVGAGKACVSTSYLFARDLLRDGRGILVRPKDVGGIAKGIDTILSNLSLRRRMEKKCYAFSRNWLWPSIANSYMHLFKSLL